MSSVDDAENQRRADLRRRQRGQLPALGEVSDPTSWPYSEENGPPYSDSQADLRRVTDALDMAQFTVGPREVLCQKCWLIHRPETECP